MAKCRRQRKDLGLGSSDDEVAPASGSVILPIRLDAPPEDDGDDKESDAGGGPSVEPDSGAEDAPNRTNRPQHKPAIQSLGRALSSLGARSVLAGG
eukprot:4933205-Pyramimonas_sp.AAC.1